MGARCPSITKVGDEALEGQIFNVFTLRDGRIVRIDDFRGRSEALAAAGASADQGWADRAVAAVNRRLTPSTSSI
jgi:hypothetical protein